MSNTRLDARRRIVLALVGMGAVALSTVILSSSSSAAEIDGAITAILVTPENPTSFDTIRTDLEWCVPDGSREGDTFTLEMPEQLSDFPIGFDLFAPAGEIVASAAVMGDPAIATFTLTAFAEGRMGVCGDAFVESNLESDEYQGETLDLIYTVNEAHMFVAQIMVQDTSGVVGRENSRKEGGFRQSGDQCRTNATDCLVWWIEGVPGPLASFEVSDTAVGMTFNCDQLRLQYWTLNDLGRLDTRQIPPTSSWTSTCTPTSFTITAEDVPVGILPRVEVYASPDVADAAGAVEFFNVAGVSSANVEGVMRTEEVSASRVSAAGGGTGNGSPTEPIVTPEPATTVTTTTTVLEVSTTLPDPDAVLLGTGSDSGDSLALYALALFAIGGTLAMIARRRAA